MDVTALVQEWADGTSNFGFYVIPGTGCDLGLYLREGDYDPYISVDYTISEFSASGIVFLPVIILVSLIFFRKTRLD